MDTEFNFKVLQGEDAWAKIETETLSLVWDRLLQKQSKLSVFQSYNFVVTWYKSYAGSYTPLLFLAWDQQGQLLGLLPLAIHNEKNYVVCAGDELAEYHGFLTEKGYEESFGLKCLEILKKDYSFSYWRLGWVAPDAETTWINEANLAKHGIYIQLETTTDPVWNLRDPKKLKKIKKRANVKRCYRQYDQRGNFRYERILGTDRMAFLLEEFSMQMDFKKEALFNRRLFDSDPHIKDFLIALQAFPEISHFSVLWLDDKPIAFNHGYVDRNELCLAGYTSYDPSESRNSPGKLHLIELAQACEAEGLDLIDLTPGKDAYKSRFANHTREVKKMTFYFSSRSKYLGDLKISLKENTFRLFAKAGVPDYDVKYWYTEANAYLKRLMKSGIAGWGESIQSAVYRKHHYDVFKVMDQRREVLEQLIDEPYEIKKNDYSDLINYQEPMYYVSRKILFQKSLNRFSRGDKLYSLSYKGRLVYLAWVRDGKYELKLPGAKYSHQFPEDSHVIYGFAGFGDKIPQTVIDAFYEEMVQDCLDSDKREIYFCFGEGEGASGEYMENRRFEKAFSHRHSQTFYFFNQVYHKEYAIQRESVPV